MSRNTRNLASDPYGHIPDDLLFFLESENLPGFLNSITDNNGLFAELEKINDFEKHCARIKFLRDFANRNDISGFFENNKTIISFHPSAGGRIIPLISINIPPSVRNKTILKTLKTSGGERLVEIRRDGAKLYGIPYSIMEQTDTLFIAFRSGLLLSSSSSVFLQKVVNNNEPGKNIKDLPGVSRIMGAAGRNEDKLFIIFRNFAEMLKKIETDKSHHVSESLARLAASAEGDIYINENGIILSGYTESVDTSDITFKFKAQQAGEFNSRDVLPSSVVLFETMRIQPQKIFDPSLVKSDDSTRKMAANLMPFMGDEITWAFVDLKQDSEKMSPVVLFELGNRNMAEQLVAQKVVEFAEKHGLNENDFTIVFQPDDQIKIPVYKTQFRNIASLFCPGYISPFNDSLIAFIDNFMITGNSYSAICKVLYDNILNKTLANDLIYRDFESTMPSRAGYYFYCKPAEVIDYLSEWFSDDALAFLKENRDHLKKITSIGFQLAASNEMIYNSLSVKFGAEIREESGAEWETLLDTVASVKPFFFTNHNTGTQEIFIQDFKNSAYLINSAGRVLWKITLNERIYGPVYMIDYYGNGKYQLLFAGRNWLHLIDRNGNYVERYPVRLRSTASGPPSLFDYDGNNEYRILIPGDDRLIYAFDKSGNVVKGWKPFMTNGIVKDGLKFFRISGKDYLVAADNANLYFLDRTGNIRLKVKEPVVKARGSEIRLNTGSEPGIVFSAPDGTVNIVSFDGNVRKVDLGRFSIDHLFDFFDVDGDGFGEYLFIDRGKLYLYDHDRSPVFEKDFDTDALEGPISFIFSSTDRKIGVFDKRKKLIFLIDKNGNTMDGFPLRGASVFSIGKLSEKSGFHLIVGGDDNFLYNYKLNKESND